MTATSRFPHPLVLLFAMVVLAQLTTYLVPKGRFVSEPLPTWGAPHVDPAGQPPLRERLAGARAARGLDAATLAALFEVSEDTVRGWELGPPQAGQWQAGTHIEAHAAQLLEAWIATGIPPTATQIADWKAPAMAAHNKTRVLPGTYREIAEAPALPWATALLSLPKGLEEAQDIIFFVFLVGGAIGVLRATGAIDALIGRAIKDLGDSPVLLIAGITTLLAIGSSTIGMAEEYMPFVPVLVTLCLALRMDAIVAMGVIYVGAGIGYGAAALNPFTVMVAQGIAGLEPTSGQWFRWLFLFVCLLVAIPHLVRYARRVQRDPERSLVKDLDYSQGFELPKDLALTPARVAVIAVFVGGIALFVYGVAFWDWYFTELGAVFLGMTLLAALFGRMSANRAAQEFCKGAAEMTSTALLIGVARTIEVVLSDGQVLHTVIDAVANVLTQSGTEMAAIGMLAVQSLCNFFVPSGSGQAYVTMPIMAPLADLTGVTRQTAVLCYQIGDGFMNMVVPTNALLMGMLALARVPYQRWMRFVLPLMLQLYAVAIGAVLLANWIGF